VGSDPIGAWLERPLTVLSARSIRPCRQRSNEGRHVSNRSALTSPQGTVIVGVDTHKSVHVAVAIDLLGTRLASCRASADHSGYAELVTWARTLATIGAFGIEGTGSYGVGLARFVRRQAIRVVEVSHCDRRKRRNNGKSDTLDAETAARSVLAGVATAVPKTADGSAEMVRQIKVARDTAVKARSAAIITLKTLIVNAPSDLRESLEPLTDRKLIDRCARLLPGVIADTVASTKHALRALAARWLTLSTEIAAHDEVLDAITQTAAPTLRQAFGIGPDSAAEMMIVAGDNPTRIRSEAAFAKLCGAWPIPASSGVTNRHRLFRGGHRQANAALYRIVTVRMRWHQPTIDYVTRRTAEGLSKKDIIRCLKRFVAREIYRLLLDDHRSRTAAVEAA
jgi:transposase